MQAFRPGLRWAAGERSMLPRRGPEPEEAELSSWEGAAVSSWHRQKPALFLLPELLGTRTRGYHRADTLQPRQEGSGHLVTFCLSNTHINWLLMIQADKTNYCPAPHFLAKTCHRNFKIWIPPPVATRADDSWVSTIILWILEHGWSETVCSSSWLQTCYVAKAGSELLILLLLPPKCWDCRQLLTHLVSFCFLLLLPQLPTL